MKSCFSTQALSQEAGSDSIRMLFGNGTEELSASFVGLKKTNTENQTQEPEDGKTLRFLKAKGDKHHSFRTHRDFVSLQSFLSPFTPSSTFQKMRAHFWAGLVSAKSLCEMSMRTCAGEKYKYWRWG